MPSKWGRLESLIKGSSPCSSSAIGLLLLYTVINRGALIRILTSIDGAGMWCLLAASVIIVSALLLISSSYTCTQWMEYNIIHVTSTCTQNIYPYILQSTVYSTQLSQRHSLGKPEHACTAKYI